MVFVHVHLSDLMVKDEFLTFNLWRQQHKIREVFLLIIKHNQCYFPMYKYMTLLEYVNSWKFKKSIRLFYKYIKAMHHLHSLIWRFDVIMDKVEESLGLNL